MTETPHRADLMERIRSRRAVVGVIGLGYVGLPLALAAVEAGFPVLGFDINPARVEAILAGRRVINYLPPEALPGALATGRLDATTDFARLAEADAVILCVPTPVTRNRDPDLSFVTASAASAAAVLRPGQLVVLESTTWPGTTAEVVRPLLEAGGLTVGDEVFLAFSPEREDPGNAHYGTRTIPKVVGADDPASRDLAVALYEAMITRVVPVSSAAAAEAAKLTENIFRSVNIALVNELKLVYDAMGIDVWEVIDAAATKPFGYMPFYPGPGLGGHCIPVDPFYLTWRAREFGMETRFIELAGQINTAMPGHVVDRLARALSDHAERALKGARILLVGAAYKKNVDDTRESPSLVLIEAIEARGAACDFHDPLIPEIPPTREHPGLADRRSVDLTEAALAGYDAVLIATDHDAVDYALLSRAARLVVDTRNAMARRGLPGDRVVKA
ncbi:MAG: nucleotide sugar dehydrogenase [Phenylobacterium sp.]|uniref:nucleotide sugar dehydrogenase n=1 Tax=Phenylobacterium sp. TaxID=1871053 RepID=UPI0025D81354|nr:nucleotide sugar dehydrogenase [Phenylobacterium sp.]MCA6231679.1 nucleotide sugar dehydrogenase [Phenylobacterium sp.]MCA6234804.1 nucleotide sugar dehydrogenase [Phenylobacterium sp.]MCA6248770.1 nucleotide sugar dehydrogenase [Phenylobacterium sp.]MCA6251910.1 nucleotide sugar dehydrogenase [Phenylobacterium sp.]MCA6257982.1 nucleotide sugar dehydrogenase [Phenylobacterium sp.]